MAPADAKKMRRNMIRLLQKRYVNTTAGYEDRAVLQPLLAFMHRVIGRTVAETQRRGNAMVLFTRALIAAVTVAPGWASASRMRLARWAIA
jgi:hypothetical protein